MHVLTIFVILLVAIFATVVYFMEPSDADKRTRERLIALNRQTAEELEEGIVRDQVTFSRIALVDHYLQNNRIALNLQSTLDQAKLSWTVGRLLFYSAILAMIGGAIGRWWIPMGFVGWIPGMLLGALPFAWVLYKRSVRLRKLNDMLPEAVDLMSRALRAGYSLPSSFVMVADEMSDPLGPEFRRTADELNYGLPFREALLNLVHRVPIVDVRFLIIAIMVQKETGGNLVELLDKIAAVLRSRIHLQQKVRVFTAQGKLTGVILVALPFVLFVALNLVRPGYTQPLFESETGRKMVYGALAAMAVGIFAIRRIIKIEV